jgi:hypothetical protein
VFPALAAHVRIEHLFGTDGGRCTAGWRRNGLAGTRLDRVATRQLGHPSLGLLLDRVGNHAIIGFLVGVKLKSCTLLDVAARSVALVDCLLEGGNVPSVDEVAVHGQSSGIAVGQDKGMLAVDPLVVPRLDVVQKLIEERDEALGMSGRTLSVVVAAGVGHVGLVVCRVKVLAVPTTRHDNLQAESTEEC